MLFAVTLAGFGALLPKAIEEPAASYENMKVAEAELVDAVRAGDLPGIEQAWGRLSATRQADLATFMLYEAARAEDARSLQCLLHLGIRIDSLSVAGNTALLNAISTNHPDAAFQLLRHGADPNRTASSGLTPLVAAIESGEIDSVAMLLQAGASPRRLDADGLAPLDRARAAGRADLASLIVVSDFASVGRGVLGGITSQGGLAADASVGIGAE